MRIAVEGCSHGELDVIYKSIQRLEEIHKFKVDLLLCCGDFQSVRNEGDLKCMAVPEKYLQMQDFHKYYSGEKKAPVLTIFIGGNHEASNYLQELPYGGWVAPMIYYLGYAGIVQVGDIRIGGLSGIYKSHDYLKGHFEKPPYTSSTRCSVYHVRNLEVFRLKQLSNNMNIFMSHDWPRGIYNHGNAKKLLQQKHHFTTEVQTNKLGSRAAEDILKKLKPNYWFSGHLHVKFSALMKHEDTTEGKRSSTKFLALDKCLPRREFLQILEVPNSSPGPVELSHDAEWLTILRLTNHLLSTNSRIVYMPGPGSKERYDFTPTPEEIKETVSKMGGDLRIPVSNFVRTAESFNGPEGVLPDMSFVSMPEPLSNPQTTNLCSKLGLTDPLRRSEVSLSASCISELELELEAEVPEEAFNKSPVNTTLSSLQLTADSFNSTCNPAEIDLSDEEEVEISKDEETGDFIMELPLSSSSFNSSCKSSPKRISPFRVSLASTPKGQTTISPFSSPRSADEDFPSKRLSLSKPKEHTSPLPSGDESEEMGDRSLLSRKNSTASSSSSSFLPLSTSSQSEGESGSESGGGLKRGGIATPVKTTKKLKRRNVAMYAEEEA